MKDGQFGDGKVGCWVGVVNQNVSLLCLRGTVEVERSNRSNLNAPRHLMWAALMRRMIDLDILARARCGGRLRVIVAGQDSLVVQAILAHRPARVDASMPL